MPPKKSMEETDRLTRIAIVNSDKCKPKRCRQECKRSCPVVRMGKLCIEVTSYSKKASISEELCIGCGICVKVENVSIFCLVYSFSFRFFFLNSFQYNNPDYLYSQPLFNHRV